MLLPARESSRRNKPLPPPALGDCPVGSEVLLPRVHDGDEGHEDGELYWEWARVLSPTLRGASWWRRRASGHTPCGLAAYGRARATVACRW